MESRIEEGDDGRVERNCPKQAQGRQVWQEFGGILGLWEWLFSTGCGFAD